jgi:anti-sigma28 factor (negative regulator of flagellin synthesis)
MSMVSAMESPPSILAFDFHGARAMPSINGLGQAAPLQPTTNAQPATPTAPSTPARAADRVELSGVSHLMKALQTNDIRVDKVADIKSQIEANTYDTDGTKLTGSLDGLLDDLTK